MKPLATIALIATCTAFFTCAPKQQIDNGLQNETAKVEPDQEERLRKQLDDSVTLYEQGVEAFDEGRMDEAYAYFDRSLDSLLPEQDHLVGFPDMHATMTALIEEVEDFETYRYGFVCGPSSQVVVPTLEELLDDELVDEELRAIDDELQGVAGADETETAEVSYDMPVVSNLVVERFIEAFSGRRKHVIEASLERSTKYLPMMRRIFKEEGLPLDLCYLPLIESGYKEQARSRAAAVGMWQFMKGTARMFDLNVDWWVDERRDPELATRAAAKFLKQLYEEFGDWNLALCGYNAGPGRVRRAIRRGNSRDFWVLAKKRLFPRETIGYVPAYIAGLKIAKSPEKYGFEGLTYQEPTDLDAVDVDFALDLEVLAESIEVNPETLYDLNPALIRRVTPGSGKSLTVKLPQGKGELAANALNAIPPENRTRWKQYAIRKGDTLGGVARKFGTTVSALKSVNKISNPRRLRIGQTVLIPVGNFKGSVPAKFFAGTNSGDKKLPMCEFDYRIRGGDTLSGLARRYQTSVGSIQKLNTSVSPKSLRPGHKLRIRQGDKWGVETADTTGVADVDKTAADIPDDKSLPGEDYVVRSGDSVNRIARQNGVTESELLALNGLNKRSTIFPGQTLKLPAGKNSAPEKKIVTYTIRRGDTLGKIARRYRISVNDIMSWNRLESANRISVGTKLRLYL